MTDEEIMEKIDQYWEGPDELSLEAKRYICQIAKRQMETGTDSSPVHTAVEAFTNEFDKTPVTGIEIMAAWLRTLSKKGGSK